MENILKTDIFFAIAIIAVVVLTTLVTIILVRLIKILGDIEKIAQNVVTETARLRTDIDKIRSRIGGILQRFFRKGKAK